MKYYTWVAVACLALASIFVMPVQSQAASAQDASNYINTMATKALAVISDKITKDQKQEQLEKLFSSSVDIEWVGRFVIGQNWRAISDEQKKHYLASYKEFLIRHYTSRFTDYNNGSFKITDTKDDGDNEYTVSMQLSSADKSSNEQPVLVDYRVRAKDGNYKIFDVIVEGVSLITTQRSEFSSVINDKGMDYLIAQLEAKSKTGEF